MRFAVSDMPLVNMWCPQTRGHKGDGQRRVGDRLVSENRFVGKCRDDLGDRAMAAGS